jgi:hypothetical protein
MAGLWAAPGSRLKQIRLKQIRATPCAALIILIIQGYCRT